MHHQVENRKDLTGGVKIREDLLSFVASADHSNRRMTTSELSTLLSRTCIVGTRKEGL